MEGRTYNFRDWRIYLGATIMLGVVVAGWGLWQFGMFPALQEYDSPEDEDIAELRILADSGDAYAMYQLVLYYGWDSPEEPVLEWLTSASEAGHAGAQNELGVAYTRGLLGSDKDQKKACHWFIKSAEGEEPVGQFNAAYCYRDGVGVERSDIKASALAYQSARNGYGPSQIVTYFRYKEGVGVERNFWISTLALQGAQRNETNIEEIIRFELTWQNKDINVFGVSSTLLKYVRHADGDWAVALRLMVLDAEQSEDETSCEALDNPTIQLSCWLGGGETIDWTDTSLQRALWLAAAQLGDVEAQQQVAEYYRVGRLFPQDAVEADYWRLRASKQKQ